MNFISSIVACHSKLNSFLLPALGVVCSVISIIVFFIIRNYYKKKNASPNLVARNTFSDLSSRSGLEGGSVYFGVPVFSYSELKEATNNFDSEKEIGHGGFGIVYHGKMINSLLQFSRSKLQCKLSKEKGKEKGIKIKKKDLTSIYLNGLFFLN